MLDLYHQKYDRDTLKANIYAVSLLDMLKTQDLDLSFVVKYILNPNYQLTEEEQQIRLEDIYAYQPHIPKGLLFRALMNKSDYYAYDSVEDFESVSLRK